jgi:hypothetical protein
MLQTLLLFITLSYRTWKVFILQTISRRCFDQRGRHRGDHRLGRRRGDQRLGSAPGRPQGLGGAGEQIWGSSNEKIGRGGTCMKLLNLRGQLMEGREQMRPGMGGNKYVLSVPRP